MPDIGNSEFIVPELAKAHLHPVAIAVFVGAMLAAIMSSADSALLAASSIVAKNALPYVTHNPSPRLTLLITRLAIPFFGGIAILIALRIQVVFDLMVDANILGLAVIIVPFILGVWWKKANRAGAVGHGCRAHHMADDDGALARLAGGFHGARRVACCDARGDTTDAED